MSARRVHVCDDSEGLRFLVRAVLEEEPTLHVSGESACADQCAREIATTGADAVITDLSMPGTLGFDVLERLRQAVPEAVIVVYSGLPDPDLPALVAEHGADAFVSKREDPDVVRRTLLDCLDGKPMRP